jgi:hypothetical protein
MDSGRYLYLNWGELSLWQLSIERARRIPEIPFLPTQLLLLLLLIGPDLDAPQGAQNTRDLVKPNRMLKTRDIPTLVIPSPPGGQSGLQSPPSPPVSISNLIYTLICTVMNLVKGFFAVARSLLTYLAGRPTPNCLN